MVTLPLVTLETSGEGRSDRALAVVATLQAFLEYPDTLRLSTFLTWLILQSWAALFEQMVLRRWTTVRITRGLCCNSWLMLYCKYWSVCVDFLYTEKDNFLKSSLVILASRAASDFPVSSSHVNLMAGRIELY